MEIESVYLRFSLASSSNTLGMTLPVLGGGRSWVSGAVRAWCRPETWVLFGPGLQHASQVLCSSRAPFCICSPWPGSITVKKRNLEFGDRRTLQGHLS